MLIVRKSTLTRKNSDVFHTFTGIITDKLLTIIFAYLYLIL